MIIFLYRCLKRHKGYRILFPSFIFISFRFSRKRQYFHVSNFSNNVSAVWSSFKWFYLHWGSSIDHVTLDQSLKSLKLLKNDSDQRVIGKHVTYGQTLVARNFWMTFYTCLCRPGVKKGDALLWIVQQFWDFNILISLYYFSSYSYPYFIIPFCSRIIGITIYNPQFLCKWLLEISIKIQLDEIYKG